MHTNIEINGRHIRDGQTLIVDSVEQTFVVKVRSLSHIHPDTIKRIVQSKYEVLSVENTDTVSVVHAMRE